MARHLRLAKIMKVESGVGGRITVVYTFNGQQVIKQFDIAAEERVGLLLQRRQFRQDIPAVVRDRDYGVFGRLANLDTLLSDGDQLEFYQPLTISPRQRRLRLVVLRKKRNGANGKTPQQHL